MKGTGGKTEEVVMSLEVVDDDSLVNVRPRWVIFTLA